MSSLPPVQKILLEDVPADQRDWMTKIIQPLNTFISATVAALNGDLTFGPNVRAMVKSISFTNTASAFPLKMKSTIGKPAMVLIGAFNDTTDGSVPAAAVGITSWEYNQQQEVQINSIAGLTAAHKYTFTFFII